ncbi:hypothetical protein SAMN04489859_102142 [Paracoccus alcaliphilus]|uniref:Uncharacterized protein n=1 Tax=Paracoccus alcaliphilus TaxID=34002 RepID=A0A1H8KC77_9RHOB|nr:hypothetical protein [Paracoccus alcaliphilus]WCR17066.1 hypothetical protein JHW40_11770 [Paracoccus alcaliphilus]SEN90096.1 hypothetical protein SAMN04489859_102142 [Paracoccus alcaliphilus]
MRLIRSMALATVMTLCLAVGAGLTALASICGRYLAHDLGLPVEVGGWVGMVAMVFTLLTVMCWLEDEA